MGVFSTLKPAIVGHPVGIYDLRGGSSVTALEVFSEGLEEEGVSFWGTDFEVFAISMKERDCLSKDAVMRPPSGEEETSAPVLKPAKDNNRKRASASEDQELTTKTTRKPRKNTIPLIEEYVRRLRDEDDEEENDDGSILVARVKKTIDAPKTTRSMVVDEAPPRTEGISEKDSGKVPESLEIEDVSHRNEQTVSISEGTGPEALRTEENAPRAIREARALGTLEVDGAHEGEDSFHDLFTSIEDAAGLSDASGFISTSGVVFQVLGGAKPM
uniref:Uncharacterized protein n=1 Tax=Nicotiana tabacum TaxID=4097 RepID=A0A1S4D7V7_TOBAC|nr:PREDICTED: uncharacterized protein LOC107826936 [Nicotiana tabacum]